MTDSGSRSAGHSFDIRPHAFDPVLNPELFAGVLTRRIIAFFIDLVVLAIPVALLAMFIFVIGIVTLGLGFLFYAALWPLTVIWAIFYYGLCFGSAASATVGMRMMDLEMRTWYGAPAYFVLGAVHAVVFWITISALTPLILVVGLVNDRRRLLHDILLGTIVINNDARAAGLRHTRLGV